MNSCRSEEGHERFTVIGQGSRYHFVPSNPWVAIGWREKQDIEVDLEEVMRRKGSLLRAGRAPRLPEREPDRTRGRHSGCLRLSRRRHRAGPRLRRNPRTWPEWTNPVDLPCRSRDQGKGGIRTICTVARADGGGAVQGASCFGPAYEFAFILDTELRKRGLRTAYR